MKTWTTYEGATKNVMNPHVFSLILQPSILYTPQIMNGCRNTRFETSNQYFFIILVLFVLRIEIYRPHRGSNGAVITNTAT
jgi:hypothetical protein